jgi:hypothetical protein
MCRCLGKGWVAVLMLAVSGCTLDSFLAPQAVVYGPRLVVPGTVTEVAAKLQDGLSEWGIMLLTKRVGADLRIAGKVPKTSTAFCLHLSEKKIGGSVKTLVRMQWDRGGDDELWQRIQTILSVPADASGNIPKTPAASEK